MPAISENEIIHNIKEELFYVGHALEIEFLNDSWCLKIDWTYQPPNGSVIGIEKFRCNKMLFKHILIVLIMM